MDRGAWLATVYKVAKSQTRLSACAHAHIDTLLVKIGVVSYLADMTEATEHKCTATLK